MSDQVRDIRSMHAATVPKVAEWLRRCAAYRVIVLVTETLRSPERQLVLWRQGRETTGRIVTAARPWESMHQYGYALDAVPYRYADVIGGRPVFTRPELDWSPFASPSIEAEFRSTRRTDLLDQDWRVMAEQAKAVGLAWAGLWERFVEYAHFEDAEAPPVKDLLDQHNRQRGIV